MFPVQKREVNTVLADVIKHMTPDRAFEDSYPQVTSLHFPLVPWYHVQVRGTVQEQVSPHLVSEQLQASCLWTFLLLCFVCWSSLFLADGTVCRPDCPAWNSQRPPVSWVLGLEVSPWHWAF